MTKQACERCTVQITRQAMHCLIGHARNVCMHVLPLHVLRYRGTMVVNLVVFVTCHRLARKPQNAPILPFPLTHVIETDRQIRTDLDALVS